MSSLTYDIIYYHSSLMTLIVPDFWQKTWFSIKVRDLCRQCRLCCQDSAPFTRLSMRGGCKKRGGNISSKYVCPYSFLGNWLSLQCVLHASRLDQYNKVAGFSILPVILQGRSKMSLCSFCPVSQISKRVSHCWWRSSKRRELWCYLESNSIQNWCPLNPVTGISKDDI